MAKQKRARRPPVDKRHRWHDGRCAKCGAAYVFAEEFEQPCPGPVVGPSFDELLAFVAGIALRPCLCGAGDGGASACLRCRARALVGPPRAKHPPVVLRAADGDRVAGVRTFYLSSLSTPGKEYMMKVIRNQHARTSTCSCPDFMVRRQGSGDGCKHLRVLRSFVRLAGGVSKVAPGMRVEVPR